MKLLSYIIKYDIGLAPNPFWGYCTLAVCTPNHRKAQLEKDDWILGLSSKASGNQIVYLMKLTEEKMLFNDYFNDKRFLRKRPNSKGNDKERVGDNIYNIDYDGKWQQTTKSLHDTEDEKKKDLKSPYVFISSHFFYFGNKRFKLDKRFQHFIIGRGIKYCIEEKKINVFTDFISNLFSPGLIGFPLDKTGKNDCIEC